MKGMRSIAKNNCYMSKTVYNSKRRMMEHKVIHLIKMSKLTKYTEILRLFYMFYMYPYLTNKPGFMIHYLQFWFWFRSIRASTNLNLLNESFHCSWDVIYTYFQNKYFLETTKHILYWFSTFGNIYFHLMRNNRCREYQFWCKEYQFSVI